VTQSIVVIAPHPDDEVLGCGGVMAKCSGRGDSVHVVVVTRGDPGLFDDGEIERTRTELGRAHELLGVASCSFLDFPAPKLDTIPVHQVSDKISAVLGKLKPDVLYLPHSGDLHHDHRVTFAAAVVAARPLGGSSVKTILSYETLSETDFGVEGIGDAFVPNVFIDITEFVDLKLEAMRMYASQLQSAPATRSIESLRALARLRGGAIAVGSAEAFRLVRHIDPT